MASWIEVARVATTGDVVLSGTQTIDGVAVAVNDRVLVRGQSDPRENGVYLVASGPWARASDFVAPTPETALRVSEGAIHAHTTWAVSTPAPFTVGTDDIVFRQVQRDGGVVVTRTIDAGSSPITAGVAVTTAGSGVTLADAAALAAAGGSPDSRSARAPRTTTSPS